MIFVDIYKLREPKNCSCGRTHRCDIKYIYIEKDAITHLSEMCDGYRNILIIADENTFAAAGEKCEAALSGKNLKKQIFSGKTLLIPDEEAVAAIEKKLCGVELIIGIGSGVIQDLSKYISFNHSIPYYIVATAPSMDGYASSGAALISGGMKVTYSTKVPDGFIGDTDILKNAPLEMIKSGYGDIVGKYSALNDWKLAHALHGEYFCDYVYDLVHKMLLAVLPLAKRLLARDEEAVKTLTEALIGVGIAMAYAESSRPASGSEHHLSHFFEITGILNGEEYFPHGVDVAYSTVITAALREKLLTTPWPDVQYRPERSRYVQEVTRIYRSVAPGCIGLQDKVGLYEKDMLSIYQAKESQIREVLSKMPTPQQIEEMLRAVGLDMAEFYKLYSSEKITDAIAYAKELKDRYTVLWMHYDLFGGM